jgi:hypothetical protein
MPWRARSEAVRRETEKCSAKKQRARPDEVFVNRRRKTTLFEKSKEFLENLVPWNLLNDEEDRSEKLVTTTMASFSSEVDGSVNEAWSELTDDVRAYTFAFLQ